jgi:hypothetical protein
MVRTLRIEKAALENEITATLKRRRALLARPCSVFSPKPYTPES